MRRVPGRFPAGRRAVVPEERRPLRELVNDRLLDRLLERSRDQAGGLRLTEEGSMLGELVRAVLERALESELTAHLGYEERRTAAEAGRKRPQREPSPRPCRPGSGPVPLGGAPGPGRDVRAGPGSRSGTGAHPVPAVRRAPLGVGPVRAHHLASR